MKMNKFFFDIIAGVTLSFAAIEVQASEIRLCLLTRVYLAFVFCTCNYRFMSINIDTKTKKGRPIGSGNFDKRLPEIRISSHQLSAYKNAAKENDQTLSDWIRSRLDNNESL